MRKFVFHATVDVVVQDRQSKETDRMRSRPTVVAEGRTEQEALAKARKDQVAKYENEYWKVVSMAFWVELTRDITEPDQLPAKNRVAVNKSNTPADGEGGNDAKD